MKIDFRQGIVRTQTSLTGPNWIQKTSLSGSTVDLNVGDIPIVITFAHYAGNYLFEENKDIMGAWGGASPGSNNGPLVDIGQTQYLYWDVDLATGALTRGWTLVPPIISATEPINAVNDTHWFDLSQTRTRVFRKTGVAPGVWMDKIRLFAAVYDSSAILRPYQIGSQVGLTGGEWLHGNLILGTNNKPLKQSDGTFATTQTDLIIYQTSSQNVRFDTALVFAQAAEELPKYHCVSFLPKKRIGLASCDNMGLFVAGIVTANYNQEEVAQVISNGVIRNEQWDWADNQINRPLFCGPHGEIRLTPPLTGVVQQIGIVYEQDSIFLNIQLPVRLR